MILFPAIDMLDGRGVRLLYGKRELVTDYGDPKELAERWVGKGTKWLHMVDLNAAFGDGYIHDTFIKAIVCLAKRSGVMTQLGGGMRDEERIRHCLEDLEVDRVIIGSLALDDEFLGRVTERYGARIVVSIDAKNDRVVVKGWTETSEIGPLELAEKVKAKGVETVVFTDVSRDGAMCGCNKEKTIELSLQSKLNIIASGGISSEDDIKALSAAGVYGAILGRCLYNGEVDFEEINNTLS
jgi:phosphoribosylformimino-5-aminoimidazole carboxamide ribotide isomerase